MVVDVLKFNVNEKPNLNLCEEKNQIKWVRNYE